MVGTDARIKADADDMSQLLLATKCHRADTPCAEDMPSRGPRKIQWQISRPLRQL